MAFIRSPRSAVHQDLPFDKKRFNELLLPGPALAPPGSLRKTTFGSPRRVG
ncbi:hypothetical protein FH063_005616 [Azospirillum argentinense]|uniref:Uncharacterized protein n=1 Tax=Azospirillum argentinense TaxID=2970906 RepID=A0A5B0KVU2_9PROT|nr:hypothetical protein FH063_005616 [Azospirillum argentinense]